MGDKGGNSEALTAPLQRQAMFEGGIAKRRFRLASALEQYLTPVLRGQTPPLLTAMLTPSREALEGGFAGLRERILGETPARGGQLTDLLVGAETDRARTIGGLDLTLRREAMGLASGAGFGAPSTGAATTLAQMGLAQEQGAAGQTLAGGQALGTLLGTLAMAAAIFGTKGAAAPAAAVAGAGTGAAAGKLPT